MNVYTFKYIRDFRNMSGSCKREPKKQNDCRSKKITGKRYVTYRTTSTLMRIYLTKISFIDRWEYPIAKSKEYWEKFCDDEEKRLIIVRNPSLQLSYRTFSKNDSQLIDLNSDIQDKISNRNFFSNSYSDDCDASDNSLHKLLPIRSNFKSNRYWNCDATKSYPKSILKGSFRAAPKSLHTTACLTTSSKVVRIPKLDSHDPQPSSRKIRPGKVDHIRTSFNVQNERKVQGENFPTLPILGAYPTTSDLRLKLTKLQKHLRLLDEEGRETKDRTRDKIVKAEDKKFVPDFRSTTNQIKEENEDTLTAEDYLKYSARFAYKALKRLTKNKDLDFKFKPFDDLQEEQVLKLGDGSFASDDGKRELPRIKRIEKDKQSEESSNVHDLQTISEEKSLEDSEFTRTDVQCPSLKSDETISRSISTGSRYTSGPSPEFVYPEDRENLSSRILSSIPKLSSFPRRNRDKCLPCMYKSLETPLQRKVSLPRTALRRIIAEETKVVSPTDSLEDSDSSSPNIPNFEDQVERVLTDEVDTAHVRFECDVAFVESDDFENAVEVADAVCSLEEDQVGKGLTDEAERKSIPESEPSSNVIAKKAKEDRRDDDTTLTNLNEATIELTRVTSLERTKVPSSSRSISSDEDDSIVVSVSDDLPKPKYLVPCHAPTNFRPSLEPLRALRSRKPTTLQDRIALLESTPLKKSVSIDIYGDILGRSRAMPGEVLEKDETGEDERPPPPPLTKAKSVLDKLMLGNGEASTAKQRHVLRKETSFAGFSVSMDTPSNSPEIYRDTSKAALRELDAARDDGLLKTLSATDFARARTKLPLTQPHEIVEILKNLDENVSSIDMLEILCKEFSERLKNDSENADSNAKERNKMITNLTRLLVDSKRYLYPDKFPSNLSFSVNQPPVCNSRLLRRVLPRKTYNLVAPLLGMPEQLPKKREAVFEDPFDIGETQIIEDTLSTHDSLEVRLIFVCSFKVESKRPRIVRSLFLV